MLASRRSNRAAFVRPNSAKKQAASAVQALSRAKQWPSRWSLCLARSRSVLAATLGHGSWGETPHAAWQPPKLRSLRSLRFVQRPTGWAPPSLLNFHKPRGQEAGPPHTRLYAPLRSDLPARTTLLSIYACPPLVCVVSGPPRGPRTPRGAIRAILGPRIEAATSLPPPYSAPYDPQLCFQGAIAPPRSVRSSHVAPVQHRRRLGVDAMDCI